MAVTVALVGAGPGDPGLLTRRGAELLGRADVVVYDRLIGRQLLDLAPADAELIDVGQGPGAVGPQAEINEQLIAHGRSGRRVVRLKGATRSSSAAAARRPRPCGGPESRYEVVPGVSSAFAAPGGGRDPGDPPRAVHLGDRGDRTCRRSVPAPGVDWDALGRTGGTLVILMGMSERAGIAERLMAGGRGADTPVAVVHWGTTERQQVVRTDLAHLAAVDLPAPAAIVIGAVAGARPRHRPAPGARPGRIGPDVTGRPAATRCAAWW